MTRCTVIFREFKLFLGICWRGRFWIFLPEVCSVEFSVALPVWCVVYEFFHVGKENYSFANIILIACGATVAVYQVFCLANHICIYFEWAYTLNFYVCAPFCIFIAIVFVVFSIPSDSFTENSVCFSDVNFAFVSNTEFTISQVD